MEQPSLLCDREALARYRVRATRDALFLQEQARDEILDRLTMVNRGFTDVAVVTPFPDIWAEAFPTAHLIADEDTLDLSEGAFDLVVHALAMHWSNDPVGQIIQCTRALRPDGLFMAVSFGGQTLHELRAALAQAEIDVTGGLSPRVAPMGEIRDLGALLQRAGLVLPVADSLPLRTSYASALHLMRELRAMGEGNALAQRIKHLTRRDVLLQAVARYQADYPDGADRVSATFELIFLHGWAPGPDQPKPLRPGSASARLADALGTQETKLPD